MSQQLGIELRPLQWGRMEILPYGSLKIFCTISSSLHLHHHTSGTNTQTRSSYEQRAKEIILVTVPTVERGFCWWFGSMG